MVGDLHESFEEPQQYGDEEEEEDAPRSSGQRQAAVASSSKPAVAPPGANKIQAAFVHKLYSMLQTPSLQVLISWSENGKVFSVANPTEFSRSVLPQYYKHNNFQSFVRQLNMYGFHKVNDIFSTGPTLASSSSDGIVPWEFQHTNFQRDRPDLLPLVKRKSSKNANAPPVQKSTSESGRSSRASSEPAPEVPPSSRAQGGGASTSGPYGQGMGSGGYAGRGEYRRDQGMPDPSGGSPMVNDPYYSTNSYSQPIPSSYSSRQGGSSSYYRPRSATSDDALSRQVSSLEAQVRNLSEALYASQQDSMMGRAATSSILRMLVNLVASMDPNGERRGDIEMVQNAITKLSPDVGFSPASYQPKTFGASSQQPNNPGGAPWYNVAPTASTRPQVASQTSYQRVPSTAESFTRGGRPDSEDPLFQTYSHFPLNNPDQYSSSYPSQGGHSNHSPGGYVLPLPRPSSSGYQASYSNPSMSGGGRPSWQTPPTSGGARADTLPPLSSLLSGGDIIRRSNDDGAEGGDRKKQRR